MTAKVDDMIARGATAEDLAKLRRVDAWPTLDRAALTGLLGRLVDAIAPHSEADPVAILVHGAVALGNLIGPGPHARVEQDRHPCRLFAVLCGETAKGRKGTAWGAVRALCRRVDEDWARQRIKTGLSSGEGVIYHVRDALEEQQPVREHGRVVRYETVIADHGEPDKRLFVIEPELASVLRRMNRDSNSLSPVLRQAWDHGDLATLTKNSPLRTVGAHVSLVAHTTRDELLVNLAETERANGFANRFLFFLVRRSKLLPEGEGVPPGELEALIAQLERVVAFSRATSDIRRDPEARALWASIYPQLSEGEPGLVGAILSRAEAQVLRLSVLYAVLDCSPAIRPVHLGAAVAVWDYAEASARRIFEGRLGFSTADIILQALKQAPRTRTELYGLFNRNKRREEIDAALDFLERSGKARRHSEAPEGGKGRRVEYWEAVE
jgi:hypothetical protein